MTALAWTLTFGLCALLGRGWLGLLCGNEESRIFRSALAIATGAVMVHVALTGLQFAGVRWSVVSLLGAAGALIAATWRLPRPPRLVTRLPAGWGDGLAAGSVLLFGFYSWRLWILFSDFIYHWGIKAQKYLLAGGVDFAYLGRPWCIRPDYPNLVPELYAVTGLFAGRFHEPSMMLWSPLFLALAVFGVREALAAGGAERFALQMGTAVFAMTAAAFGIGYRMGGSADWAMAAAMSLALPALLRAPSKAADLQIGVAAALGAGAKLEGVPLAAILVGTHLFRRARAAGSLPGLAILRTGLAPALVILPWLWSCLRHNLFVPTNPGTISLDRLAELAQAFRASLLLPPWHGFDLVAVLLPPVLLFFRPLRPLASAACLQFLLYCYVYLSTPDESAFLVRSSLPRLLLHLLPASLTGVSLALATRSVGMLGTRERE